MRTKGGVVSPDLVQKGLTVIEDVKDIREISVAELEMVSPLLRGEECLSLQLCRLRAREYGATFGLRHAKQIISACTNSGIPEEWKKGYLFFLGTVLEDSNGDLCVPCLKWREPPHQRSGLELLYYWVCTGLFQGDCLLRPRINGTVVQS